jgi:tripartite-type tricarboxylate transporter receptor subunit TctC
MHDRIGPLVGAVLVAAWAPAGAALAQAPAPQVRIVVSSSPGGNSDLTTRLIAKRVTDLGGPQVIIENRTGGSGVIAAVAVKQSAPDGTTLLLTDQGLFPINAVTKTDLPFDPIADFKPVTLLWSFPSVVAVPASLPAHSVAELVQLARTTPGGISYGSQGAQSGGHLLGVMFGRVTGAPLVHVPYRGAAPAVTDLVAGRVSLMFVSYSSIKAHVESKAVRILAAASAKRIGALPDVPTLAELGYRDVELETWFGLVAPAGTPDAIVGSLNAQFVKAARTPDIVRQMEERGVDIRTTTPAEFTALIQRDITLLGPVLKAAEAPAQ